MSVKYLLDTHTWIWLKAFPEKITLSTFQLLENTDKYDELLLSSISIWELCKLVEKKKLSLSINIQNYLRHALFIEKLRIVDITTEIAIKSTSLPKPFHNDPADQIIVASSIIENATLITKDEGC